MYKSTSTGGVAVYQAAGGNTSRQLPDWIEKKRKRALKNDLEYQNRVTLIQDFEFSEASNKIKVTPDGKFAMATGTYKPQIHVYDFENASLKFERHTDCENVDFLILSNDWSKSVHLQNDRSIQFQIRGGLHYTARIPKFGRAMSYNFQNCDLYLGASGNELYRLNLEQGRFLQPFELDTDLGCNALDLNKVHGLLGAGLEDGTVEFWDPRSRQRVAKLLISDHLSESTEISDIAFRNDGLNMACGTSTGKTLLYDLRNSQPYIVKDQGYGNPIKKIIWLDENSSDPDKIMTADKRIAKIWERHDGKPFASMEPSVDINDVEYLKDSGMFFMANEGIDMHAYYIPELGPAPKWVAHLDNLIDEERPSETVYSKYRFITRKDVANLNLSHLIGTKVLRSYMHGFFIDNELYDRANLIANPNAFRDQREREIKKKIEEERESRIRSTGAVTKTKVKVNKDLAEKLQKGSGTSQILNDDRFKEMFEDPDFQIDTESHEYKQLNPVLSTKEKDIEERRPRGKTNAEESDDERMELNNRGGLSSSDEESGSDSDESDAEEQEELKEEMKAKQQAKIQKQLLQNRRRQEVEAETEKFLSSMKPVDPSLVENTKRDKHNVSFGSQAKKLNKVHKSDAIKRSNTRVHKNAKGELELTFTPSEKKKPTRKVHFNDEEGDDNQDTRDKGRTRQRFEGRRRASKNAFRGM